MPGPEDWLWDTRHKAWGTRPSRGSYGELSCPERPELGQEL